MLMPLLLLSCCLLLVVGGVIHGGDVVVSSNHLKRRSIQLLHNVRGGHYDNNYNNDMDNNDAPPYHEEDYPNQQEESLKEDDDGMYSNSQQQQQQQQSPPPRWQQPPQQPPQYPSHPYGEGGHTQTSAGNNNDEPPPLLPNTNNPYGNTPQQQQQQQPQQQQPYGQQQQQPPPLPQQFTPPRRSPRPNNNNNNNIVQPPQQQQQQQQQQKWVDHSDVSVSAASSSAAASSVDDGSYFDKDYIFRGLKRMYRKKIMPLELASKYGHFYSPPLSPSDFEAKPMILLLGQYSVGKTSFIQYLLGGKNFPGMRIGPEPTTDRFVVIMESHDSVDKLIPGAALASQADRPFRGLSSFGNSFLSRLEGVELNQLESPILQNITLVDTPGILSGQKQSMERNYDYEAVMKWFAERADLIIIMFDAHKLDISDELKSVIELMSIHSDKVRVVLNKADMVSTQQLMRVYGALMWSLGKVMMTPEVCRVYMGSFWGGRPPKNVDQAPLLEQEKADLFSDISNLPQNAVMRRINELVKRARYVKVHAYIVHYLRKQLPYNPWGRRDKQVRLLSRLERELTMCARRYELPKGDFPTVPPLRKAFSEIKDWTSEFPKMDKRMVKEMDKVFSVDIPDLLEKARMTTNSN